MTVAVIRNGALESQDHIIVRQLAEDLCRGLRSKDYLSEVLATRYFVETKCRYMRDPRTIELVKAPYVVAQEIDAGKVPCLDCDDMVAFITALLLAMGSECAVVTFAFHHAFHNNQRQYSHVAALATEPKTGTRIVLDPVAGAKTQQMLKRAVAAKIWSVA